MFLEYYFFEENRAKWGRESAGRVSMLLVYVTCKDAKEAERIGTDLVGRGLAACANYYGGKSIYQWKGRLVRQKETILELKTVQGSYRLVEQRIRKMHSYELPAIIAVPAGLVEANYLRWVQFHSTGRMPVMKLKEYKPKVPIEKTARKAKKGKTAPKKNAKKSMK